MNSSDLSLTVYIAEDNSRMLVITNVPVSTVSIQIYRSYAPTESWENIAELVHGECSYNDTEELTWDKECDLYYRIDAVLPDSIVSSCIMEASSDLAWPYDNLASSILTSAYTEITNNGRSGKLLKALSWGTKCTKCSDYGIGRPTNEHCSECFGTGYSGGYYEACTLDILDEAPKASQIRTQQNYSSDYVLEARCIAFPLISRGDIWVGDRVNDRYFVDNSNVISSMKGIPLIYGLVLRRIEQSDVVYSTGVSALLESSSMVNWSVLGK